MTLFEEVREDQLLTNGKESPLALGQRPAPSLPGVLPRGPVFLCSSCLKEHWESIKA